MIAFFISIKTGDHASPLLDHASPLLDHFPEVSFEEET